MSGPKRAKITIDPTIELRKALERLKQIVEKRRFQELYFKQIRELEGFLNSSRRKTKEIRKKILEASPTQGDISELLTRVDNLREEVCYELALFDKQGKGQDDFERNVIGFIHSVQGFLNSRTRTFEEIQIKQQEIIEEVRQVKAKGSSIKKSWDKLQRNSLAYKLLIEKLSKSHNPSLGEPSSQEPNIGENKADDAIRKAQKDALRTKIIEHLESLKLTAKEELEHLNRWSGENATEILFGIVKKCEELLAKEQLEEAMQTAQKGLQEQNRLSELACQHQEAHDRCQTIANLIMGTLCERNYDSPIFGPISAGDPLSGIQIRADVPNQNGIGNIRVDISIDGNAVFEVENVAKGEETMCVTLMKSIGSSLEEHGAQMNVTDWGRATSFTQRASSQKCPPPSKTREKCCKE